MKILDILNVVIKNASVVRHYANLIIHVVDMLDGVQDWQKNNPAPGVKK